VDKKVDSPQIDKSCNEEVTDIQIDLPNYEDLMTENRDERDERDGIATVVEAGAGKCDSDDELICDQLGEARCIAGGMRQSMMAMFPRRSMQETFLTALNCQVCLVGNMFSQITGEFFLQWLSGVQWVKLS
jgi:hypothetical protein